MKYLDGKLVGVPKKTQKTRNKKLGVKGIIALTAFYVLTSLPQIGATLDRAYHKYILNEPQSTVQTTGKIYSSLPPFGCASGGDDDDDTTPYAPDDDDDNDDNYTIPDDDDSTPPIDDDDDDNDDNNDTANGAPYFTSFSNHSIEEGLEDTRKIMFGDPEDDDITCRFTATGNPFDSYAELIQTGPYECELTINAQDQHSDKYNKVEIELEDSEGNTKAKSKNIWVDNTELIEGNISDIDTEEPINEATVFIGDRNTNSDANGNYSLRVLDSDVAGHNLTIDHQDHNPRYAGQLLTGKGFTGMNQNYNLIHNSFNMAFFNEVCRGHTGATQRIPDDMLADWIAYVNTSNAIGSGVTPTEEMQDMVEDIIANYWPWLTNGKIDPVSQGNLIFGTNPPTYGTENYTIFRWDDNVGALHYEYMSGNEIISNYAKTRTSNPFPIYLQELLQVLGPRKDSDLAGTYKASIFQKTGTLPNDTQPIDILLIKILYDRAVGTTSQDNAPTGYKINPNN